MVPAHEQPHFFVRIGKKRNLLLRPPLTNSSHQPPDSRRGHFMTTRKLWPALICLFVIGQSAIVQAGQSLASVYSYSEGKTASGEPFSPTKLTAAHRSLPFGTFVRVTNLKNRQTVIVRINDRGPFSKGRVIDVTPAAAHELGFSGLVPVALDIVTSSQWREAGVFTAIRTTVVSGLL
jgi:rare lipoprotein A